MSFQKLASAQIKGRAASSGIATGKVRVVTKTSDFHTFQQGDILVTKMTQPNMVIVMLKASAIVTDLGGLTCHAAILSRELGVPCVVATGIATKTLKTGVLVEVNGNTGEVNLIN